MAVTASATPDLNITFTLEQSTVNIAATEIARAGYSALTFGNGTGMGQINMAVKQSGYLPSGQTQSVDMSSFPKRLFNTSFNLDFTSGNVKGFIITNTNAAPTGLSGTGMIDTSTVPYINILATGTDGFSGLFNGGSGNVKIRPQSTWGLTNIVGIVPTSTNKTISIRDSGSGVPYELLVVGVTG